MYLFLTAYAVYPILPLYLYVRIIVPVIAFNSKQHYYVFKFLSERTIVLKSKQLMLLFPAADYVIQKIRDSRAQNCFYKTVLSAQYI